jgi:hypothetical protein
MSIDGTAVPANKRSNVVKIIHCGEDPAAVTCLIGSPKFRSEFQRVAKAFALDGEIVLTPNVYSDVDGISAKDQKTLHEAALQRIQMADKVYVVNPNNRMTENVYSEIEFAESLGRRVTYMETPASK